MEILKLCRSCMKEAASWELENFNNNVVSMFTFCTSLEVSEADKLPKQFCYDCTIKIESSYTFIKKAQEVNVTMKNILSSTVTSVIVKSENFINSLQFNDLNSLQSDLGLNSKIKLVTNEEKIFVPNSSQGCENREEYYVSLSEPIKREINESLQKDFELADLKFDTTDDFDAYSEEMSNADDYNQHNMGETNVNNNQSNDKINEKNQTDCNEKNEGVTLVHEITDKFYNTRSKIQPSDEMTNEEKLNPKETENKTTLFQCDICKNTYTNKKRLQNHIKIKHSKDINEKDRDRPKEQKEKGENTNPDLKTCDFCGRTFTSAVWFSRHIEKEHSDSAKQYSCPHCTKTFLTYSSWFYHKDKHQESWRFACETCGARFKRGKHLAAHAHTHATARPHVCTKCGMAFKTKSILAGHMKRHLDEKRFLCSACGFSTSVLYTLKSHILTHTGEKPYACQKCSFRSSTTVSLRRHELRHRGERRHACQQCGKRFYEPGALARHIRIHTGERPFQCYLCSQTFIDGWKCKSHIMRSHNIPLENIPRLSKVKKNSNEAITQPASEVGAQ